MALTSKHFFAIMAAGIESLVAAFALHGQRSTRPSQRTYLYFLWGEKTCCPLIATPNVDNANRRQKKGKG
jgi:hypothetical protein